MLTHNDVHLLVGLLTQITSPDAVEVELGARVPDAATGTARDVDITVTARHPDGAVAAYTAIEVKDEKHPLDTQTVEQLIQKLNDMPSITSKAIVSSSGYTKPARAKAAHHGVALLSLRDWERGKRIYPFLSPDLEAGIHVRLYGWAEPPSVKAATDLQPHEAPAGGLKDSTLLMSCANEGVTTLAQLSAHAQNQLLSRLRESGALEDLPPGGRRRVQTLVQFPSAWKTGHGNAAERIHGLHIDGEVTCFSSTQPVAMKLLVDDATDEPHAACLVGLMPTNDLVGAVFTSEDINPHFVRIPVAERNLKVIARLKRSK